MISTNTPQQAISIRHVSKVFGSGAHAVRALDDVDLEAHSNEFFTLLGPSGCGKTTLLRIIAGFEDATDGQVLLYGDDIHALSPNRRPVNTVFQHYALFPHMTVGDNVAFGLRRLGKDAAQVTQRVNEMLALVQLTELRDRSPSQLSGGQQQRVALARALAPNPKVLLLDEPLSALDLKLRQAMRVELKQLQQETGITFVFVTHDQEEALAMSDRIAVMSNGKVQQVGTPNEIYEQPLNRFVADFIGDTNLIDVSVDAVLPDGEARCSTASGLVMHCWCAGEPRQGAAAHVSIRPEKICFVDDDLEVDHGLIPCTVEKSIYLGTDTVCVVALGDGSRLTVRSQNALGSGVSRQTGSAAKVRIEQGAARLLVD